MDYNPKTQPGQDEPTSEPEHLEINSRAGQENTSPEPDAAATEPGEEKMNPEPEYEKIKTPIDLNEIFDFEGGYGKPPRHSRFRKGTSGNHKGRPPGSKNKPKPLNDENFNEILRSELYKEVRINGGPTVSIVTAIMQKLGDLAIGGNIRAIQMAIAQLRALDAAETAQQEAEYNYWMAYVDRLKKDPMRSFYDSRRPVPDPKDIIFDHINKRVLDTGPRNEEEMFEKFAEKDLPEETTDEEEEEDVEVADECSEELHCPPRSYSWDPDEPEEPRLRTPSPDNREDERLRTSTPDETEEPRLRKPAPDETEEPRLRTPAPDETEEPRLRTPAPDEPEEPRLRKPAPEVEDECLRTSTPDEREEAPPEAERLKKPTP